MSRRVVYGISDWPETLNKKFEIFDVKEGETDEDAIRRAKKTYSEDLECCIEIIPEVSMNMPRRVVYGISDWPETLNEKFEIFDVREGETDEDAIKRAKKAYSEDLECCIEEITPEISMKI